MSANATTIRDSEHAATVVSARWLAESASREEIVAHFKDIDLTEGFALLARMREACEIAAKTIEQHRLSQGDEEKCSNPACGITRKQMGTRNWRLESAKRDNATGIMVPWRACSDACVVQLNRINLGVGAMSDRGMLPGDDPSTQKNKNSIIAHQEKVQAEFAKSAAVAVKREAKKAAREKEVDEAD